MKNRQLRDKKIQFSEIFSLHKIIEYIVSSIITYIITGIIGLSGIVTFIRILFSYEELGVSRLFFFVIIVCAVLCFLSMILNFYYFKQTKNKGDKFNYSYRCSYFEQKMILDKDKNVTYYTKVKFEVLDKTLGFIEHKFFWTGGELVDAYLDEDTDKSKYSMEYPKSMRTPFRVKIKFSEIKKYGETGEYSFIIRLIGQEMEPTMGKTIKCQINKLVLKVCVPTGMISNVCQTKRFFALDKDYIGSPEPPKREYDTMSNLIVYSCSVDKPDLLRFYDMNWEFNDIDEKNN